MARKLPIKAFKRSFSNASSQFLRFQVGFLTCSSKVLYMGVDFSQRLGILWKELRNRKVFQVALVYILMAWGIMQVGDLLFEALQMPEEAYTLLVILILLGFPVAVVLAWAYEITPDGVRRDIVEELRRETMSQSMLNCSCGAWRRDCQRVAILPFRDMAPEHDLGYFCEGVAEEIQNALCEATDLEIVARAHSVQFGGKKIDIDKIRRELCVNAVIEGSVRRSNGQYRVSVQLVDVRNGIDIWSRSLDMPNGDDFDIQKRVAAEVASHTVRTFAAKEGDECESVQLPLEPLEAGDRTRAVDEQVLRH